MRPLPPFFQMPPNYPVPPFHLMARNMSPFMQQAAPIAQQLPMQSAQAAQTVPKWEQFLQSANSLMSNAQKFTPYVEQAAPMIKNLPALWQMYRGFKNSPSESSTIQAPHREIQRATPNFSEGPIDRTPKPSMPKIYQPPYPF